MSHKKIGSVCAAAMLLSTIGSMPGQMAFAAEPDSYFFHSTFESGTDNWSGRGAAKVEHAA